MTQIVSAHISGFSRIKIGWNVQVAAVERPRPHALVPYSRRLPWVPADPNLRFLVATQLRPWLPEFHARLRLLDQQARRGVGA